MERRLGLLLVITLGIAIQLGAIALMEPGRIKAVEARAAEAAQGGQGAKLYADNCASCHGKYGEGQGQAGPPPLSSREFLSVFDDATMRAVIAKGKASRGMPAWSKQNGGQLAETDIEHLVTFIRGWQLNPPQIPPKAPAAAAPVPAAAASTGSSGAAAAATSAPAKATAAPTAPPTAAPTLAPTAVPTKSSGAATTTGAVVAPTATTAPPPTPTTAAKVEPAAAVGPSFAKDILPALQKSCGACHQAGAGGFNSTSYDNVMGTGAHKPVVLPGDPDGSLLIQKLKGTQTTGAPMPMAAPLAPDVVQQFVDWVQAGAKDN